MFVLHEEIFTFVIIHYIAEFFLEWKMFRIKVV